MKNSINETGIIHIPTKVLYVNRKVAKMTMGKGNYNRALKKKDILFVSSLSIK